MYVYARLVKFFLEKMVVKFTIFELQQSYFHIFGVAQNFQLNGRAPKRGGGGPPPPPPPYTRPCLPLP